MATPFVQGQLRKEYLSVEISSECGHCSQPLHIQVDSELKYHVQEEGAKPIIVRPNIDLTTLNSPNIIEPF